MNYMKSKKGEFSMRGKKGIIFGIVLSMTAGVLTGCSLKSNSKEVTITNVSYDPTRELYDTYNTEFAKFWEEKTGQEVTVIQSHGGSGKQARSVIEGNEADVVTLALAHDITAIEKSGLIQAGWIDELVKHSAPYTSTIVFLFRSGNTKGIREWDDLVKEGVEVITPNPKTSGGARWNFLAAWSYAKDQFAGDETRIKDFVRTLYQNVKVLDSGARASTTTFVENEQGDVLIAWENEAYLSLNEYPGEYEMIKPSISILTEPSVAIVDEVVEDRGTLEVSKAYLEYLYSDVGQRIAGDSYYRPSNPVILQEYKDIFDLTMKLVVIDDFGGWDNAFSDYFQDGAIFDQIYAQ